MCWGWAAGAAGIAAAGFSARWNWWRPRASGLPVLMYHMIGTPPGAARLKKLWVRPEDFRRQIVSLRHLGFEPVRFSQLSGRGAPLPRRPLLITFDDGTADLFETALPILRELDAPANVFLVHDCIGGHTAWDDPKTLPWRRMLTWEAALSMRDTGLVEFGSHTMTHPDLRSLPLEEARWQIRESKKRLEERLDRPVEAFAYPYGSGAYEPGIREMVREAGYLYDCGVRQGISPWPWLPQEGPMRRLLIRGDDFRLDFYLNLTRGKARF